MRRTSPIALLLMLVCLLAACAPAQSTSSGPAAQPALAQPQAKKVLVYGYPKDFFSFDQYTGAVTAGQLKSPALDLAGDFLARTDSFGVPHPSIAPELPAFDNGTWRVNPDGTMDLTWKLRPNVKWHDGAPFSADDVLFGYQVFSDPAFQTAKDPGAKSLITSVTAPDPLTVVVHWKQTYATAGTAPGLDPWPAHLLAETYRTDKQALLNTPYMGSSYVGLGPYRVNRIEPGTEVDLVRFDDYFLGRPPLDEVLLRFIADDNARVVQTLAGQLDVAAPPVSLSTAATIQQQWQGTGNQVIPQTTTAIINVKPQFRSELARPQNGLQQLNVRKALLHGIDRQQLADIAGNGFAPVTDSWVLPDDPDRAELEAGVPRYPHDLARAQQLLADAGWTKGPDGVLVHASGERFDATFSIRPDGYDQVPLIIQNDWKALGANVELHFISQNEVSDRKFLSQATFATLSKSGSCCANILTSEITGDHNNWSTANNGGYSNPRVDDLYAKFAGTIDPKERNAVQNTLLREVYSDLANLPLYVMPVAWLLRDGVNPAMTETWRVFGWDKRA
ncbi:MAG: peptide/nickel transport system substrate-binding protein [Chloroflexota bacterium]|nr:peptide/nickel transport system substrate-binding protein [Chloroflexota bacterium]